MATSSQTAKEIIFEVKQQYCEDLQKLLLENISCRKDVTRNDYFREGSYGKVIDLTCGETECVGKVLHPVFFSMGTEPAGMRCLITKFFEEIKLLSKMDHPNIVKFLGLSYQQDSSPLPLLVMEKMDCCLTQYISTRKRGSIRKEIILQILVDVAKGLVYLHEDIKVAHRDLSSNNILLGPHSNAKIADLGSARVLNKPGGWNTVDKLTTKPGVLDFMPPEALLSSPVYTVSVDVFSFACVIIHLCTHKWPTPVHVDKGEYISEANRRKKYIAEMSAPYLVPLVKQCLDDLSALRPTSREVMMYLLKADTVAPQIETTNNRNSKIDYTIVFVGIAGAGKSEAGNFFLEKEFFKSESGFLAVTEECKDGISTICGKTVQIIDTPGCLDGFTSTDTNLRELSRVLTLAKDGVHAVALVITLKRFTAQNKEFLNHILYLKGMIPYMFVLITHAESNGITKEAAEKYIEECLLSPKCPPDLKRLMHKVQNRVIMVESVRPVQKNYPELKRRELMDMVKSIFKKNENKRYNNALLRLTARCYENAKQQQAKNIQKLTDQIKNNLEKIEELQKQHEIKNNTQNRSNKIAELQKQNKILEGKLEIAKSEKYLQKLTDDYMTKLMKESNIKGKTLKDFISSFSYYVGISAIATPLGAGLTAAAGAIIGGGIGAVAGSIIPGAGTVTVGTAGAQLGASVGGVLGGVGMFGGVAKDAYDDCNQQ